MIAPDGLHVGQEILVGSPLIDRGNTLPLGLVPEGTLVFNIEKAPGDGGKYARAGGTAALVISRGPPVVVRLPSGAMKPLDPRCRATVGVVAGSGHQERPFYKSGKVFHAYQSKAKAYLVVSGVAMNAVNHPHGGGSHQHVGKPSTVSARAPPGRKVGRLAPQRKKRRK